MAERSPVITPQIGRGSAARIPGRSPRASAP